MRQLREDEIRVFFAKLKKFIGDNIKFLIQRKDEPYVFRIIKSKVYYMSEKQMLLAQHFQKENILQ